MMHNVREVGWITSLPISYLSHFTEPCQKNTETLLVIMSNIHEISSKNLYKMNDEETEIELTLILQILGNV